MIKKGKRYKYLGDPSMEGSLLSFGVGSIYQSNRDGYLLDNVMQERYISEEIGEKYFLCTSDSASNNSFEEILNKMKTIYNSKNADYGNSFGKSLDEFGIIASTVRISDKVNRLINLTKGNKARVKDESLEDTLLDLANYAVMTIAWMEEKK